MYYQVYWNKNFILNLLMIVYLLGYSLDSADLFCRNLILVQIVIYVFTVTFLVYEINAKIDKN